MLSMGTPDVEAVGHWLADAASDLSPHIAEMHLFGSLLERDGSPSDVDIVIVFRDWDVRDHCTTIKERFRRSFGYPLHMQMFHISQGMQLTNFLEQAARTRRIL